MSRVNQPDTLVTELREIKRRLRLLEGTRPAAAPAAARAVPFAAARTEEWPGSSATDWTPLVRVLAGQGTFQVVVESVCDADTSGEIRVVVAGEPAEPAPVTTTVARSETTVTTATSPTEIVVEAHRTDGTGAVRAVAFLLPGT